MIGSDTSKNNTIGLEEIFNDECTEKVEKN